MSKQFLSSRKRSAVTPVIATIILIAATIVLSLVVGAYTYGIFRSNVVHVNLMAVNINSGTASSTMSQGYANLQLSVQNPGSTTAISSITLLGMGLTSAPKIYQCSSPTSCSVIAAVAIPAGAISSFIVTTSAFYIGATLVSGGLYSYVVQFSNGQAVSGSLIAQ